MSLPGTMNNILDPKHIGINGRFRAALARGNMLQGGCMNHIVHIFHQARHENLVHDIADKTLEAWFVLVLHIHQKHAFFIYVNAA